MSSLYVGSDIAQATFAVGLWDEDRGRFLGELKNELAGFQELARWVVKEQARTGATTVCLVLEPTGGYEVALALFALEHGWRVCLPNPRHVRDFAKGLGQRAKTDKQDALLLARYGSERKPAPWAPLPAAVSELESLLERKRDLEQMLHQEHARQKGWQRRPNTAARVLPNVAGVIEALQAALAEVEAAIGEHLKEHPELAAQARQLQSVPGVGKKSVLPLLVLLHRWHVLTGGKGSAKKLSAYAGLDPQTHTSGTSVRGRETISRMGDRRMRARLYMCALGGAKGKNALREYYQRMLARGKAKKLALVAASRKILIWAWAVFRDHVAFQEQKTAPRAA
jgi:transposase